MKKAKTPNSQGRKGKNRRPSSPLSTRFQPLSGTSMSLSTLRAINGPKCARGYLGFSLKEMAEEITRLTHHKTLRGVLANWEAGRRLLPAGARRAYAILLANHLSALHGREIGVKLDINSPWHVTAWARCQCGTWFKLRRANHRRCSECAQWR